MKPIQRRVVGTVEERFWSYVIKTDTCWLWTGQVTAGYGALMLARPRRVAYAHRLSWELLRGPIPEGYFIDHDNPSFGCHNPLCVNPDHLEPVPPRTNLLRPRSLRKDNTSGARGVCWNQNMQKWFVNATANGVTHSGGYFANFEDATQAARALRERLGLNV